MTLTLLLKSVGKKNSYFQQIDPFNLFVAGNADENMRIKYWGWKYRDEKLGMNNPTMQYIFFLNTDFMA